MRLTSETHFEILLSDLERFIEERSSDKPYMGPVDHHFSVERDLFGGHSESVAFGFSSTVNMNNIPGDLLKLGKHAHMIYFSLYFAPCYNALA